MLFGSERRILFSGSLCSLLYAVKALGPVIALLISDFGKEVLGHDASFVCRTADERLGEVFEPEQIDPAYRLVQS